MNTFIFSIKEKMNIGKTGKKKREIKKILGRKNG